MSCSDLTRPERAWLAGWHDTAEQRTVIVDVANWPSLLPPSVTGPDRFLLSTPVVALSAQSVYMVSVLLYRTKINTNYLSLAQPRNLHTVDSQLLLDLNNEIWDISPGVDLHRRLLRWSWSCSDEMYWRWRLCQHLLGAVRRSKTVELSLSYVSGR